MIGLQALVRTSGALMVLGALLLLAFWWLYVVLLPYRQITDSITPLALHRHWRLVNALGVLGSTLLLTALPGFLLAQLERIGGWGLAAGLVAIAGSALLLGPLLWDTVLWPVLARYDTALLKFTGAIYQSRLFLPFFVSAGLLWASGWSGLAAAGWSAGVLPRYALLMVAVGAPLFALGSLFGLAQAIPRSIGITLFSVGACWLGGVMWLQAPTPMGSPGQDLRARLSSAVGVGDLPGLSLAVARRGAPLRVEHLGVMDLEGRPVGEDTVFLWMSMTKVATAVAVQQLVDRGRLSLDEPAAPHLPALAAIEGAEAITIRRLLNHSSGLPNPLPLRWVHAPGEPHEGATAFAARQLEGVQLRDTPGARGRYSNLNYLALGAIIEAVDGRPYEQVIQEELLTPLGMLDTRFELPEVERDRVAAGTLRRGSPYHLAARWLLEPGLLGAPARGQVPLAPYRISGAAYGGLLGPARDLVKLGALFVGQGAPEVLSAEAAAQMLPAQGERFGLGWQAGESGGRRYVQHMGGGVGQFAQLRVYPDDALALAVMSNASGGAGPVHPRVLRAADLAAELLLEERLDP